MLKLTLLTLSLSPITCGGPTCETTCERVFLTCGFDYENGATTQTHITQCEESCQEALEIPAREEEAVFWMSCISDYPCENYNDPNGFDLQEACPPNDFYYGDLTLE